MEPNEIKVEVGIPVRGCNTDERVAAVTDRNLPEILQEIM